MKMGINKKDWNMLTNILSRRVIKKVRIPTSYLNKIKIYRTTHEAEIQSHISFTFPNSHQVCLDTYHSDISIYQVLH
jgi:hypothetical protein